MSESPRAEVILRMGRQHLLVRGIVVATEGDLCRDPSLPRAWSASMLRRVAALLNDDAPGDEPHGVVAS